LIREESKLIGKLSTHSNPASSKACSATDLPEPEMPVIIKILILVI
jgi:hypothetical protein